MSTSIKIYHPVSDILILENTYTDLGNANPIQFMENNFILRHLKEKSPLDTNPRYSVRYLCVVDLPIKTYRASNPLIKLTCVKKSMYDVINLKYRLCPA